MQSSPYLARLKLAIEGAADPTTRAMRRADWAACQARLGGFGEAEAEIASLRAEFGDGRNGRVSIMIMCAEAQLIYFRNLGDQARDRMMRAQLLAVAGRDAELTALTSAWLAHIAFNLQRHQELARAARTCLDVVSREDHEAVSRLALTLGDAFYVARQPEVGNRWYAKAHEYAVKLGDHSTIAAYTYNRAALGIFMARLFAGKHPVDRSIATRLAAELRSAANYQAIAQLTALQALIDYSQASSCILIGQYENALGHLERLAGASTSPLDRSVVVRCDQALCLAKLGRLEEAQEVINTIRLDELVACPADDQVVGLCALGEAARLSGATAMHDASELQLASAVESHDRSTTELQGLLAPFVDASADRKL
jgi:hypothetical protein